MKIAIFHNLPLGGAKRTLMEQMKYLCRANDVDLYELKQYRDKFMDISYYAKNVYRYDFTLKNSYKFILNRVVSDYRNFISLKYLHKKIASDIDSRSYDVVLVHTDKFTESPFILQFLNTPNIYHCHELLRIVYEDFLFFDEDVIFLKKWYENITRLIRKRIDLNNSRSAYKIVTSSDFIGKKVKNIYGKKYTKCLLGVDSYIFRPRKLKKRNYILFIGGRNKLKGYDLAEKIMKIVNRSNDLKLKEYGFLKNEKLIKDDYKLSKEYSNALLTLCAARNEPYGLITTESMACETPVLAVNEGGYRETVVDGVTGYLLPRDPKAFAEKIVYLYNHPEVVRKMGKAGREHVKKNFTWEKHVKCIEKQLYEIAKKKHT